MNQGLEQIPSEFANVYQETLINEDGKVGKIKLLGKSSIKVPSKSYKEDKGYLRRKVQSTRDNLLVQ